MEKLCCLIFVLRNTKKSLRKGQYEIQKGRKQKDEVLENLSLWFLPSVVWKGAYGKASPEKERKKGKCGKASAHMIMNPVFW